MNKTSKLTAIAALTAFIGTAIVAPLTAHASEEGKRNSAYGLGAAALLLMGQKNKLPAALAGAGAGYSAYSMQQDINKRHKKEKAAAYHYGYRNGKRVATRYSRKRR